MQKSTRPVPPLSSFPSVHGPSKFNWAIMKTMVITVSLALILPFGSKTKAEEKVGAAKSQSERLSVADLIATQFHSYSTELTIRAADVWSNSTDGNFAALSEVSGLSESAMDQGG